VIDEFIRSLLLERDDDERDEDVDEEEWKDDEVDDVEDGHLHAEVGLRTLVLVRRVHRVNQHPEIPHKLLYTVCIVTYREIVCGSKNHPWAPTGTSRREGGHLRPLEMLSSVFVH